MDEFKVDLITRLAALEYVLTHIGKAAFLNANLTPDNVRAMRESAQEKLRAETVPGLEAVWSDHLAAEVAQHADRLLADIESLVADAWTRLGRPQD